MEWKLISAGKANVAAVIYGSSSVTTTERRRSKWFRLDATPAILATLASSCLFRRNVKHYVWQGVVFRVSACRVGGSGPT